MSTTSEQPTAGNDGTARLAELESRVAEQAARLDEVLRAYSRLQQERDDFRRRLERERDRVLDVERGNVALGLLEAIDELDRSIASAPPECAAVADGVRLIRDGLSRRVAAGGIQRFEVLGQPFDPAVHEAIDLVSCDRAEDDGRVVEEIRAGYRQGDRVLRPARVRVGRFPAEAR
ncbi:MAG: nucleotide exchange factor GrpE [Myxococcales bacterium]